MSKDLLKYLECIPHPSATKYYQIWFGLINDFVILCFVLYLLGSLVC